MLKQGLVRRTERNRQTRAEFQQLVPEFVSSVVRQSFGTKIEVRGHGLRIRGRQFAVQNSHDFFGGHGVWPYSYASLGFRKRFWR